jgi:hypothetical protein
MRIVFEIKARLITVYYILGAMENLESSSTPTRSS